MGIQAVLRSQVDESDQAKITVLLVDDHPFVLEGIRFWLTSRGRIEVVGEAVDGQAAVDMAAELLPDVVVMDITMPIMNGLDATRLLRTVAPESKVLILSMHETREFTSEIVAAGARGYLSKNTSPSELICAIEAVHRGETYFNASLAGAFLRDFLDSKGRPKSRNKTDLSLREREVVTLVTTGLCNKEVADRLGVSVRTIEKHRERIMHKLQLHGVVELTRYAITHQLIQLEACGASPPPTPVHAQKAARLTTHSLIC